MEIKDLHHEWILALTGWILYNLFLIQRAHKEFDTDNNGYSLREVGAWLRARWIGILFSFILMVVVTLYNFMPEIWKYAVKKAGHEEWKWIEPFYLFTGALASGIQFIVNKLYKL